MKKLSNTEERLAEFFKNYESLILEQLSEDEVRDLIKEINALFKYKCVKESERTITRLSACRDTLTELLDLGISTLNDSLQYGNHLINSSY